MRHARADALRTSLIGSSGLKLSIRYSFFPVPVAPWPMVDPWLVMGEPPNVHQLNGRKDGSLSN